MKIVLKTLLLVATTLSISAFAAEQDAMQMHEHMEKIQEQMAAIRAEQDPARRAELMKEHHASMSEGLRMMEHGNIEGMSMEQRMHAMEERMDMMSMMMGQMMEHHHAEEAPADDAPAAEHQH
jgi:periplasmic protein CpxP/Spy